MHVFNLKVEEGKTEKKEVNYWVKCLKYDHCLLYLRSKLLSLYKAQAGLKLTVLFLDAGIVSVATMPGPMFFQMTFSYKNAH